MAFIRALLLLYFWFPTCVPLTRLPFSNMRLTHSQAFKFYRHSCWKTLFNYVLIEGYLSGFFFLFPFFFFFPSSSSRTLTLISGKTICNAKQVASDVFYVNNVLRFVKLILASLSPPRTLFANKNLA